MIGRVSVCITHERSDGHFRVLSDSDGIVVRVPVGCGAVVAVDAPHDTYVSVCGHLVYVRRPHDTYVCDVRHVPADETDGDVGVDVVRLVNMTPHAVHWTPTDGETIVIPPSGRVPRVAMRETEATCSGLPVTVTGYGEVVDLPEPESGTVFIVSQMVAAAMPGRRDLVFPHDLVRDADGRVVGCRRFGMVEPPDNGKEGSDDAEH